MTLFDEQETFGQRTIYDNEAEFDYYQGSARPAMIRVKDLLESWFAEYPNGRKKESLRRELRGEKYNGKKMKPVMRDKIFNEAFFELYIYILLRRLGCEIIIEPSIEHLEGKKTAPDFLATHKATGYSFYLEATVQYNEKAHKQETFLRDLKSVLDQMDSPDFVICIDRFRITSKVTDEEGWTPSTARFVKHVKSRLSNLASDPSSTNMHPPMFNGKGWTISFHFESRAGQEEWTAPPRTFKETASGGAVHSIENIRKAIEDKACHYGKLDRPFVIAINPMEHLVGPDMVVRALYGSISHIFNLIENGNSPIGDLEFSHNERKPDGSFLAGDPQYTRVSAIWIASGLFGPSVIGSAKFYEFENLFAERKFRPPFPCLRKCCLEDNGKLTEINGLTPQQILQIEKYWPEYELFAPQMVH